MFYSHEIQNIFLILFCLFIFSCDSDSVSVEDEDFTSILLTDPNGGALGYEGIEGNYGNCTLSIMTLSYPYPNPSNGNVSINYSSPINTNLTIKVINQDYEQVDVIYDSYTYAMQSGTASWDGYDSNNNLAPNGYYRMIINTTDLDECYLNFKKE